jgi:hypothetical protein
VTIQEISRAATGVLEFISKSDAKPEEKIAILRTAAATIEAALSAEAIRAMYLNLLTRK